MTPSKVRKVVTVSRMMLCGGRPRAGRTNSLPAGQGTRIGTSYPIHYLVALC
jgi:hypothetical protein